MSIVIYTLLAIMAASFVTCFVTFSAFMIYILNLNFVSQAAGKDTPVNSLLTGGFGPMWRVLRYERNSAARRSLVKRLIALGGSFAVLFGSAFLFIHLNEQHCVIPMSQYAPDGTKTQVCPSVD